MPRFAPRCALKVKKIADAGLIIAALDERDAIMLGCQVTGPGITALTGLRASAGGDRGVHRNARTGAGNAADG